MTVILNTEEVLASWPRLLEQVRQGRTEVTITEAGVPVARLLPILPARVPGQDAGQVQIAPDFDTPLPDDLLDAFEGR
jgi:antitoxin (DNA-binding transcriptional repressor) of toxin-antitoxin stability system